MQFKHSAITEFLTVKKFLPPTFIVVCRQCVGINVLMLAHLDVEYGIKEEVVVEASLSCKPRSRRTGQNLKNC